MNNLLSVFVGGVLAISGSSVVKWLEYQIERRSLRKAMRAEIMGMLTIVERRGHHDLFREIARAWRAGDAETEVFLFAIDEELFPVYRANVGRVGLLGGDVAGDVVKFYDLIIGVKADIRAQINGETRHWPLEKRAALMETDIEIFAEALELGKNLVPRL